jgi:hypothetical protein
MSRSFIDYKDTYFEVGDRLMILSLHFLKVISEKDPVKPNWFEEYVEKVVDVIIEVKPIGWIVLDLDQYFIDSGRIAYFVDLIEQTKVFLLGKKYVYVYELNEILSREGSKTIEFENFQLKTSLLIAVLDQLKGLLHGEGERSPMD